MASQADKPDPENAVAQVSVVAYRFVESRLEFCLITARRSGRWGFPKGRIDPHPSAHEAALAEALEEAGLTGRIAGDPLGRYKYKKRGQMQSVLVLSMEVDSFSDVWQEADERERRWASLECARGLLDRPALARFLDAAIERHAGTGQRPADGPEPEA